MYTICECMYVHLFHQLGLSGDTYLLVMREPITEAWNPNPTMGEEEAAIWLLCCEMIDVDAR